MISSHLPSIDFGVFRPIRADQDNNNRPAGATESSTIDSLAPRSHRRVEPGQEVDTFLRNATHLVKDTLRDFGHGIMDTIADLGFDENMIKKVTKAVLRPIAESVRSGPSFSASLMFAAVSVTHDAAGSAFSFFARNIDIEINFETGSVNIASIDLAIEGEALNSGALPHLLDVTDGATEIPQIPDLLGEFREFFSDQFSVVEIEDEEKWDEITFDDGAGPDPDQLKEAIENLPDYRGSVRVSVMAHEYFRNESNEQMLRLRLNAMVSLIHSHAIQEQGDEPIPEAV